MTGLRLFRMRGRTNLHFISVSRAGVLMARRKGHAPVEVAKGSEGLVIAPDEEARARGLPESIRVLFAPGGGNRLMLVLEVITGEGALKVNDFQERYSVSDAMLGRWMRVAVEKALDEAEKKESLAK